MKFNKSLSLLAVFVILGSGCASSPEAFKSQPKSNNESVANSTNDGVVCTYEKKLGKLIKEKVCTSKRDREIMKETTEETKREMKSKRVLIER